MGQILKIIIEFVYQEKKIKLFMLGIWESGKTTLLYRLKLGETIRTFPSIGFNIEDIKHNDVVFQITEAGGGDRIYALFSHYMADKDGIIIVVDSSYLCYQELLQSTLRRCIDEIYSNQKIPVLILANKSDKCKFTDNQILQYVGIHSIEREINYKLIYTNCFSGEGLNEALNWLYLTFKNE